MSFIDYLKSKQNLLVFWLIVHGFALFVNLFSIQGDISSNESSEGLRDYSSFYLLAKSEKDYYSEKPSSHFWPIVQFYKSNMQYNPYMDRREDFSSFNGIFYQYDISEFLAYSVLIFIILYFKWSNKQSNTTTPNKASS